MNIRAKNASSRARSSKLPAWPAFQKTRLNRFSITVLLSSLGFMGGIAPVSAADAARPKWRSFFTPPADIACRYDVVDDFSAHKRSGFKQNSRFQRAVDAVSRCRGGRGGILTVPRGLYKLKKIKIPSNVHLRVAQGAVFEPSHRLRNRGNAIFEVGVHVKETVRNVSIVGLDNGFKFDLRGGNGQESAIHLGNVQNFRLTNFEINDNGTSLSSIAFRVSEGRNGEVGWPRDGVVNNIHQRGADIGYGLIQTHALKHVFFDDLSSEGGVTLRLEPDSPLLRELNRGGIFDLHANNIGCIDGMAAVMLSPHGIDNGVVKIKGVQSVNCAFAVRAEPGAAEVLGKEWHDRDGFTKFIARKLGEGCHDSIFQRSNGLFMATIRARCAKDAFRKFGAKTGKFSKVNISNIVAKYGYKGQFGLAQYEFLSCGEQRNVCISQYDPSQLRGGSIAAVYNMADPKKRGGYRVTTSNVHAVGHRVHSRTFVTPRSQPNTCQARETPASNDYERRLYEKARLARKANKLEECVWH